MCTLFIMRHVRTHHSPQQIRLERDNAVVTSSFFGRVEIKITRYAFAMMRPSTSEAQGYEYTFFRWIAQNTKCLLLATITQCSSFDLATIIDFLSTISHRIHVTLEKQILV